MRTLLQTVEWSRRNSFPRPLPEPKGYSPRLRRDQVKAVYYLKRFERRPMTKLVQEAVDRYLEPHGGRLPLSSDALPLPRHAPPA